MLKIHIIGLDHFLQNPESVCSTEEGMKSEREQKQNFELWVREILDSAKVQLIAEEAKLDRACRGSRLAEELRLDYINITMPLKERARRGITPDYEALEETRLSAFEAFEQYMFRQVKASEADVVLVMCGRLHLKPLGQLFTNAGDHVYPHDVNDCGWFLGLPQETIDGQLVGYHRAM